LVAWESIDIHSQVTGVLKQLNVGIGDKVKQGQILADIEAPELAKGVDQAKAALDLAGAKIEQQEAMVAIAQPEHKVADANIVQREVERGAVKKELEVREKEAIRIKALKDKGVIAQEEFDTVLAKFHAAEAKVSAAKVAVDIALTEKLVKQSRLQLA